MSKQVRIVSDDARFSRMLSLVLSEYGLEIVSELEGGEESTNYTVVDLDTCTADNVAMFAQISTLIGFSTRYAEELMGLTELCTAFLHRPFPIGDLTALFGHSEKKPMPGDRPQKASVHHKKLNYLTVDPVEKAAVWGDMHISLSDNEYKVLALLCENRGETVEREVIYSLLGAEDGNMGDVYICHLRRKIDNKLGLKLIYTVRGKGYMLKN